MIAASRLGSTDLALAILHLLTLPLCHDCSVNQVLECREGMIHQLILERVDQASQEPSSRSQHWIYGSKSIFYYKTQH
jgi:hypothetical protein